MYLIHYHSMDKVLQQLKVLLIMAMVLISGQLYSATNSALFHQPDIYGNTIVFTAGGDLWSVAASGGAAVRLTMNDGREGYAKFSPDGKMIAFTGEYDGNADVYVMDTHGGHIRRLTFHPGYDLVVGWHPIKNKIIFRSARDSYSRFSRLYMINPDGTGLERLILHEAVQGSFSPDGRKIAYNRVSRETRTWKRYRGGTAQEVYIYDFKTQKDTNITNFRGTDRLPMWMGDKIYFSSDRDRVLNIYAYDTKSGRITQLTHHKNYDVRWPSMGPGKIVYELGGDIWVLNVSNGQTKKVPIEINSDFPETRPYLRDVKDYVTHISASPSGKRALITARGEIFSVPRKEGVTLNLSQTSASREKEAVWSPDGKSIAFLSDRDGEYQLYTQKLTPGFRPVQLTRFKKGYRHTLRWSPNSKMIAYTDQTLSLYYIDVNSKKITKVDKADYQNIDISMDLKAIYDFAWSPDSRYLAYSKMDSTLVNKIYIYSLDTHRIHCISGDLFNDFHPVFSRDGAHLFFISNRRFDPTFGDIEWEMVYKNLAGIYVATLRKNGPALFPLKNDEDNSVKNPNKKKEKPVHVQIDFAGLQQRIEALPLKRGNYRYLSVNDKNLFYLNKDKGDFNRFEFRSRGPMDLYAFSLKDRKEAVIIKKIQAYDLSADGSTIIYKKGKKVGMIASSARDSKGKALTLDGLKMQLNPREEWRQIYNEAWRIERDFYYEPHMHGVDWKAMHDKYAKLLPRATCREDVRFLIGELIGELNTSHTYVYSGDYKRKAKRVNVGLLGADYGIDAKQHRYYFKKIYQIPEWLKPSMPPLFGPGKNIKKGDYLLAVDGQEVTTDNNIYSYFVDKAGKEITLTVNSRPDMKTAHTIIVKPLYSEYRLRYLDWLEHNRKVVDKASHGLIGYIHLPDTYVSSARIFPKYFYSQTTKKGLIVDGRYNGGGLDPSIFLDRLAHRPLSYWTRRYSHDYPEPWMGTNAHMVCLTNRQAGSGGDELPWEFRHRKMGKIIGTRSWGGLVGYSADYRLVDGGVITMPDYRIYDTHGKWTVENEGVTPDIPVDLEPAQMAKGYDAQLMKAVEVLMKEIKADPRPWPKHEPFPVDKE